MVSRSREAVISLPISLSSSTFFLRSFSAWRACACAAAVSGAQFRLAEPGSLALPPNQPAALESFCRVPPASSNQNIQRISPPRPVPGWEDGKAVDAFFAGAAVDVSGADLESIGTGAEAAVVGLLLLTQDRPFLVGAFQPVLIVWFRFRRRRWERRIQSAASCGCRGDGWRSRRRRRFPRRRYPGSRS